MIALNRPSIFSRKIKAKRKNHFLNNSRYIKVRHTHRFFNNNRPPRFASVCASNNRKYKGKVESFRCLRLTSCDDDLWTHFLEFKLRSWMAVRKEFPRIFHLPSPPVPRWQILIDFKNSLETYWKTGKVCSRDRLLRGNRSEIGEQRT